MVTTAVLGMGSVFTLAPGASDAAGPDVLGLWGIAPAVQGPTSAQYEVPFRGDNLPTWQVNLPADPAVAATYLTAAERRIAAAERILNNVPTSLVNVGRRPQSGAASFGPPATTLSYSDSEARLLSTLDQLWLRRSYQTSFNYGVDLPFGGVRDEIAAQFQSFVDRVTRTVLNYARVETRIEGRLLAQTVVGWTSDAVTTVEVGLDTVRAAEHGRALAIALASRAAMLRTIGLAARGAAILASLLSGGGAVLAIPATWRYIRDILETVRA